MIKKGIVGIDDYAHFGRLVDEISPLAYAIMLVPLPSFRVFTSSAPHQTQRIGITLP